MEFRDKINTFHIHRIIASIVLIVVFYSKVNSSKWVVIAGTILILLAEVVLLLAKETWWSNTKYILVWVIAVSVAICLQYGFDTKASELLWALVWILGMMEVKYRRLSMILASITIVVILIMSYNSQFSFLTLLALIGIYMGVNSSKIRKEAYRTSKLHLKELNDAHNELQRVHRELEETSMYSMRYAALEERTRLAREIHDGIGHQLTSLIIQLQALEIMISKDNEEACKLVSQLIQISKGAMAEIRFAVKEWSDDEMGLGIVALKGIVSQTQARSSIQFKFYEDSEISEWSMEISIALYRILQESLTNILRHSKAESAEIHIEEINNQVVLSVSDNGEYKGDVSLDLGFGMKGIIVRCRLLGGFCTITHLEPHGLYIRVNLPID